MQDNGLKYLHYVDNQSKFPMHSRPEDLPDRLDIMTVTEIATVDWTDRPNMLWRDGGLVSSEETLGFINALTEFGLKIKLLGACV